MRLLLHQFRKDFRQTWLIWVLWLFFVAVQFGLAAWTVEPGDLIGTGIYGQIIGMVPSIHAILLFVLIPLLIFQETPVGTTAFWLTRPIPPLTVLGSKLISFGILVLVPLLGQCFVLASHHVIFRDVVLAGAEIALKELSWIALATGLAVLCPNFGAFMVAAAALYILQYFSGWLWNWLALLHPEVPPVLSAQSTPFITQSRLVASDLLCIVFGFSVVFFQYLLRRTRAALTLGVLGLIVTGTVAHYWAWDFVNLLAEKPHVAPSRVVAAPLLQPDGGHSVSVQNDSAGRPIHQTLTVQFSAPGLALEENMILQSEGGEQVFLDGSKLALKPDPNDNGNGVMRFLTFNRFGFDGGFNLAAIDAALGNVPILNQQFNANLFFGIQDLFSVDSKIFVKRSADLGRAIFHIKGFLSGYRITAEIPLRPGTYFADGSRRTTITQVLPIDDGLSLMLSERSLNLLFAPNAGSDPNMQPCYFLLNRKRSEAIGADNNSAFGNPYGNFTPEGIMAAFNLGDNRFEIFTPLNLTFHSTQMPPHPLIVPIDAAWLANATLVRLEPEPHGEFTSTLRLPDFTLDGNTLPDPNQSRDPSPNLAALQRIVLPPHPSRADVWHYILRIYYQSARQRNSTESDPQVEMLARVGPEHAKDLLVAALSLNGFTYALPALKSLDLSRQDDFRQMLLRILPARTDLVGLVVKNHWALEAKPILLARVINRNPGENIDDAWLDALNLFPEDPKVKAAMLDLLPSQQNVIRLVIADHWELDAKPILLSVIARTKPGNPIDDRWIQVLDSFHDDSRVKAMLLRALPSDPSAIETIVENHWEADAKPILLGVLNKAKPGDSIDDRWFRVLASLPDQSGVQEAILRILPFCRNAIGIVIQNHWEMAAYPVILHTLVTAHPTDNFDDSWFIALNPVSRQPGVKETILRILPTFHRAIEVVSYNHWEVEAKGTLLEVLNKAKPGDAIDEAWYTALDALPDKSEVKPAILRILPFIQSAAHFVIENHWQNEARPMVLATLLAAKPTDNFNNEYISLIMTDPPSPEAKSAILHILPGNDEAIDFITQNHWEADAEPILLRRITLSVLGQDMSPKWIKALASVHDAKVYPLLLDYVEKRLNSYPDWSLLDAIRPLPGTMVAALVGRAWNAVKDKGPNIECSALSPVASWGFSEALDRAGAILAEPRETDKDKIDAQDSFKNSARNALYDFTPCGDRLLDSDLAASWISRKSTLGFDPEVERFLPHPKPIPANQSWQTVDDTMRALGYRAERGDFTAFDELENAIARAREGIDPREGARKLEDIRHSLGNSFFAVLRDDVEKNPSILKTVEYANKTPDLRSFVVDVYGRAAGEGNQQALDALLDYPTHNWNLLDVVKTLDGAISRGEPKAISFEGNLPHDPNSNAVILNWASEQLFNGANAGNQQSQEAYRAIQKGLPR